MKTRPQNSIRADSSRGTRQSGQSLIEVSLLLPLLIVLLMGGVDLGRYAYIGILVGNAAHAGALYGAQSLVASADTVGIQAAADNDYQNNGQSVSGLTVTSSTSCGCDSNGTVATTYTACSTSTNSAITTAIASCTGTTEHWVVMVSVTTSGTYNTLFPYPGIPSTGTVTRTATMRVAQN